MPEGVRLSERSRQIAVAVARACLPPGRRLPAGGPATVEQLSRLTHGGRPFSALDVDEGERHLVHLADGSITQRALALGATMPLKMAYFDNEDVSRELRSP